MFGRKKKNQECCESPKMFTEVEVKDLKQSYQFELKSAELAHKLALQEKDAKHALELAEREFQVKHFKDEEIKKLSEELNDRDRTIAELTVKVSLLDKMVDLHAGIIDVKDLVKNLIDKIPSIDLKNLTLNSTVNQAKQ